MITGKLIPNVLLKNIQADTNNTILEICKIIFPSSSRDGTYDKMSGHKKFNEIESDSADLSNIDKSLSFI